MKLPNYKTSKAVLLEDFRGDSLVKEFTPSLALEFKKRSLLACIGMCHQQVNLILFGELRDRLLVPAGLEISEISESLTPSELAVFKSGTFVGSVLRFAVAVRVGSTFYRKPALGYVDSLDPTKIVLSDSSLEVVSHENIHVLQYSSLESGTFFSVYEEVEFDLKVEYLKLPNNADFDYSTLSYLMDQRELEARLHDYMVSYYAKHNSFPTDAESIREFTWFVMDSAIERKGRARFNAVNGEMEYLFSFVLKAGLISLFAERVLPLMVINLLSYYGVSSGVNLRKCFQ